MTVMSSWAGFQWHHYAEATFYGLWGLGLQLDFRHRVAERRSERTKR